MQCHSEATFITLPVCATTVLFHLALRVGRKATNRPNSAASGKFQQDLFLFYRCQHTLKELLAYILNQTPRKARINISWSVVTMLQ